MGIKTTRDIALIAILTCILFAQEELLTLIPNVSLTVFLIVLYSKKVGLIKTSIIVLLHTILDNLFIGSFNIIIFPAMLAGWLLIPVLLNTIFKKVEKAFTLALLGVMFSLLYSWMFIIPNVFILNAKPLDYLKADILFELILCASSFLSILWLYKPLSNVFDKLLKKEIR